MVKKVRFTLCILYCVGERKIPLSFTLLGSLDGALEIQMTLRQMNKRNTVY